MLPMQAQTKRFKCIKGENIAFYMHVLCIYYLRFKNIFFFYIHKKVITKHLLKQLQIYAGLPVSECVFFHFSIFQIDSGS